MKKLYVWTANLHEVGNEDDVFETRCIVASSLDSACRLALEGGDSAIAIDLELGMVERGAAVDVIESQRAIKAKAKKR